MPASCLSHLKHRFLQKSFPDGPMRRSRFTSSQGVSPSTHEAGANISTRACLRKLASATCYTGASFAFTSWYMHALALAGMYI